MKNEKYGTNCIGNVIRIIDERTIIVNIGHKVLKVNDYIQVYEFGPEIEDCDGTSLGNYEFIKDKLKVIEACNNYSVCQKQDYKELTSDTALSQLALSPLFVSQKETEYIPLNVRKEDIKPLKINDPVIHIGDPIKRA